MPRSRVRKCPDCTANLRARLIQGIFIDDCPNCRGVWLDAGEYQKVFALLSDAVNVQIDIG